MEVIDAEYLGISKINRHHAISFNWDASTGDKFKQWVARIIGVGGKYGLQREFVRPRYKPAPRPGLMAYRWDFRPGNIYQYKNFMTDYINVELVEGFVLVLERGIVPLEYEQVRLYYNMPVKEREKIDMPTFNPQAGGVDDDLPF